MLWIDKNNIIKEQNDIVIVENDRCYYNPSEEILKEHGWLVYEEEENIEDVRQEKLQAIDIYDKSSMVNRFSLNGVEMWLDKSTRSGLMLRLNAEYAAKKENTVLWYNGRSVSLPVSTAIEMLNRLEIYASQCYDKTQDHLSTVSSMTDPEDILRYDYTKGYPEMIHF